jgi:hypothetical protein
MRAMPSTLRSSGATTTSELRAKRPADVACASASRLFTFSRTLDQVATVSYAPQFQHTKVSFTNQSDGFSARHSNIEGLGVGSIIQGQCLDFTMDESLIQSGKVIPSATART